MKNIRSLRHGFLIDKISLVGERLHVQIIGFGPLNIVAFLLFPEKLVRL